jgi:nicotinic acid phosphoribosyltransferase
MKTLLTMMMMAVSISVIAQQDPIDDIINQYSGKDGFTTVLVNSDLFELIAKLDVEDKELQKLASQIESIRIIANEEHTEGLNFFDDLAVQIPFDEYKELLVVKEKEQDVQMLVKETDGIISEFLLLAGGKDNAVISIRGNIDLKSLGSLSDEMGIEQLSYLQHLEDQQ